ncbi:MAG: hypothetical protein EZS28_030863 [Streblomastix strix]|uniref:Uncharacterized protein n=1 Tax=Streblomastix strix TaxID=222440 RepID=A0A5J4UUK9_9EUKA|nr:MAG: hypothetical protein EZS28_030863 [Streblomastix strix]
MSATTLINVLTTLSSVALFNSHLCSNEALDDSRTAAVEGKPACFKQLNLQAVNNQHEKAEVQVSVIIKFEECPNALKAAKTLHKTMKELGIGMKGA